nr:unnamed protein product [Digitaria exilis]
MSGAAASRRASSAATAKRPAVVAAESAGGVGTKATRQANKRAALGDVTNVTVEGGGTGGRAAGSRKVPAAAAASKVNSAISAAPVKKVSLASSCNVGSGRASAVKSASAKSVLAVSRHDSTTKKHDVPPAEVVTVVHMLNDTPATALCNSIVSPPNSEDAVSIDGTMSTCNSTESPDFECSNNGDSTMLASLEEQANEQVHILENRDETTKLKKNVPDPMEIGHVCAVENKDDPQFYPTLASDIYTLLREAESEKRPSTDFMVTIQKDITPSMRAILIDWLVEVAEEYHLVPDTLYLTVNYIDRYLSGNKIGRQRLQLLGVACMLIAAKNEEICAPQAEEFCYITDNSYFRDEDPAYVQALANYITELSLLEYNLLCYPPSQIAASAIFLAKYVLYPTKHPWQNPTLARYTRYKPSELCKCVKALHHIFDAGPLNNLPAVKEKYGQDKYKSVAKMPCPAPIPTGFFEDATC